MDNYWLCRYQLNIRFGEDSHASIGRAREVISAMSGGEENSCGQQCSTASERRLTTDLHQQEHNVGVKVSIQLAKPMSSTSCGTDG